MRFLFCCGPNRFIRFLFRVSVCLGIAYCGLAILSENAVAQAVLPTALYPVGMTQVEFVDPADTMFFTPGD